MYKSKKSEERKGKDGRKTGGIEKRKKSEKRQFRKKKKNGAVGTEVILLFF
jgi:hypothetical protein